MPDPPDVPPEPVAFDWEVWRSISKQLKYPDPRWWDELPEIACPTLIIGGGSTSHVPQELLVRVANLIPNARLVSVDGAGHNIHTDRLDEFMTALHGFLSP